MKVFISWSGDRSLAVATLLKNWLRLVIQALNPWLSSQNIENGSLWYNEITNQLKEINTGIICLTQENKNKPWILFEAGALAKGLSTSRVCTLLIDLAPKDVEPPLSQFNHTRVDREGMRKLIGDLNARLENFALDESILTEAFDAHWPRFEQQYKTILQQHKDDSKAKGRTPEEVMNEILENTRLLISKSQTSAATLLGLIHSARYQGPILRAQSKIASGLLSGKSPVEIVNEVSGAFSVGREWVEHEIALLGGTENEVEKRLASISPLLSDKPEAE